MDRYMIYGATGYTGRLIAREAARRGQRPLLGGRTHDALATLGEELGLPWLVAPLDDAAALARGLEGVAAVLHCAGPFFRTSAPMLAACLAAKVHYLDITGEVAVFEAIFRRHGELVARGITAIPGVGFDVVPTDCLAALLAARLPGATTLRLGFAGLGAGSSHGTMTTAVEQLHQGSCVRRDGRLARVPIAHRTATLPLDKPRLAMTIPWGDLASAYRSTKIPNIETYLALPRRMIRGARLLGRLGPLLATSPAQWLLHRLVDRAPAGPSDEARANGRSAIFGQVESADGHRVALGLATPEGYTHTVDASLAAVEKVLAGGVPPGALTPSLAFGADFVLGLPGVGQKEVPTVNFGGAV